MKKFSFKMEHLLRIRAYEEKLQFASYAKVLGEYNKNNSEVLGVGEKRDALLQRASRKMSIGEFDLRSMQYMGDYLQNLEKKKSAALHKNSKLQSELDEKREQATQARKKRKILEILREKQYDRYLYEYSHEETKALDEFNQKLQWRKKNNEKSSNF